jgi:hypothetical protein
MLFVRPLAKGAFEPKASVFLVGQGLFLSSYWASPDEKIAEGQPKNHLFGPNSLFSQEVYCCVKTKDKSDHFGGFLGQNPLKQFD